MKLLFRLTCFLAALLLSAVMYLGWSRHGLLLLQQAANRAAAGVVFIETADGALFTSWRLGNVKVTVPGVRVAINELGVDWNVPKLVHGEAEVRTLEVKGVEIVFEETIEDGETKEESADKGFSLPALTLPLSFLLERLQLDDLRLSFDDGTEITYVEHLGFKLSGSGNTFKLENFNLKSPGYTAVLNGSLIAGSEWDVELGGELMYGDYGVGPFAGKVDIRGPLSSLVANVDVHTPAEAHVKGTIFGLPSSFSYKAELEIIDFQLADGHDILPEMMISLKGPAEGDLVNYGGQLQGRIDYLDFHDVDVEIDLQGNYDQIEFYTVTAKNSGGEAYLKDGLLSWEDDLEWRGELRARNFNPGQLLAGYPGSIDFELVSSGSYSESVGLVLTGDFNSIKGTLRGFDLEGETLIEVADHTVSVRDTHLASGEAALRFDGSVRMEHGLDHWRESIEWKTDLELRDINPEMFIDGYPGSLSGVVNSSGTYRDETLLGRADITSLSGVVRGYPVSGRGLVHINNDELIVQDVQLISGNSRLQVNGRGGEQLDLNVSVHSENLGEFIDGARGALEVEGNIRGKRAEPLFTLQAGGSNLSYGDISVSLMNADFTGGFQSSDELSSYLRAESLVIGTAAVDRVESQLKGTAGDHLLRVLLERGEGWIKTQAKGRIDEDFAWHGQLFELMLSHALTGEWKQEGVAQLLVSGEKARIDDLCVSSGTEDVCLKGDWHAEPAEFSANLSGRGLELSRLKDLLSLAEPVWGTADLEIAAGGDISQLATLEGELRVDSAGIGRRGEQSEWEKFEIRNSQLSLKLLDETLAAGMRLNFADDSTLDLDAEIPGVNSYSQDFSLLQLRGQLRADIRSLEFLAPLTLYQVRPSGTLQGAFDLSGTLFKPVARGEFILEDGLVDLPKLGISMTDVSFKVTGYGDELDIQANATSGPGWLRADGSLLFGDDGVEGDFRFIGEEFETVLLPEYEIRTTPDLSFVFSRHGGKLTGAVVVPHGVIAPEEMTDSLTISDDVVFLDGEEERFKEWPLGIALKLTLGDDVRLDGYGVRGYLNGFLDIEQRPGAFMTGKGELSLHDGVVSIYGRTLDIIRSRLLFSGGQIDNPGIDVRAEKIVADRSERGEFIQVGVDVSGTVDDLEFALYSNPPMDDTDILAYMIVGQSMSEAGKQEESLLNSVAIALGMEESIGFVDELSTMLSIDDVYLEGGTGEEMSLVLGKRLTKKLYLGYDHNFFDQKGEVKLRYDLGKGFYLETRSSPDSAGADVMYSFER